MVQGGVDFPSVFVVDSKVRPPPLPPKPGRKQRSEVVQKLLVILVFLALCGMAVEACFIFHLYTSIGKHQTPQSDPQTAMSKQEQEHTMPPKQRPSGILYPSKPMAQLTTGHTGTGIMLWNISQESILYRIKHKEKEGKLIIEKEGYYSIYSKIHFEETSTIFSHSVVRTSPRYAGGEMLLLQSSRLLPKPMRTGTQDNSYLSGVFHLFKGDAIYVRVRGCKPVFSNSAENYFGVYMV